jgi:hypothetical protein
LDIHEAFVGYATMQISWILAISSARLTQPCPLKSPMDLSKRRPMAVPLDSRQKKP